MFQGVHSTVIGDSHIRKGIVCQDSSGTIVTDQVCDCCCGRWTWQRQAFPQRCGFKDCCKDYDKVIEKLYEPSRL